MRAHARWLRHLSLVTAVALLVLNASPARAELIPSGRQRLTAADAAAGKAFGDAVAIDGDTAVIGAPLDSTQGTSAGAAYVFVRSNGAWMPHPSTPKLFGSASVAGDQFGSAVAISGQAIVVSAVVRSFDAGGAYAFRRASSAVTSAWNEEQNITPSGLQPQDQFGSAVSLSGNTILVGARGDTGNDGAAYVFVRGATSPLWTQQGGKLLPNPRVANANFGVSVAIQGDTAIIGAPGQTDEGSAFVFRRAGTNWSSAQSLSVAAPLAPLANGDSFGHSVAVSGNGLWVLVGAPGSESGAVLDAGAVYFFERSGAFVSRQRFDTPTPVDSGEFGSSVAMAGSRALVGGPQELNERGQAHLFSLSAANAWQLASSRLSSGRNEAAGFGKAVAISADSAFVGVSQEPCSVDACAAEGAAYAYGIVDFVPSLPLLPGWRLYALGLGLGLCAAMFVSGRKWG